MSGRECATAWRGVDGAGQLELTEEGEEKLLFAGIWWQLVITARMQWNTISQTSWIDAAATPWMWFWLWQKKQNESYLMGAFFCSVRGGADGCNWDSVCRSENSSEVSWARSSPGTSSSAHLISNTIYSFPNRFSCKLHASTLTKTKRTGR